MKERKSINNFFDICEHIVSYNKLFKGQLNNNLFEKSEHQTYSKYKYNANKRGIIFNISQEEFNKFFKMKCTYCGSFLEGCNGIDRINSNKGYFSENCTPCCKICNFMKLDYTKDQFIEKCLMITYKKYNMIYKIDDLNTEKAKLIKMFQNIEYVKETLNEDFKYIKDESYYKNLIWNYPLTNIQNIKIKLVFATSPELMDIWYFYRNNVSSIPFQKNSKLVGRVIYILVKDKITDKYLGIMSLSSDIMHLEDRDDYIGWTHKNKVINKKINYLMNLSTCVSLQPFGFNFNGGKLLTKLAFSKEISDFYQEKYNQPLLGITTTGLYGKSIQYDRLKELKFVGYTKGNSTYKIPSDIIEQCKLYLMSLGKNYSKKLFIVSQTLKELGLDKKDYMSDNQKGIYFGFCHPQAQDFLCENINNLDDLEI
jgi:esterase/lipase superfamily enzyme